MGSYEWPCPSCGQTQKVRAPNGSEVTLRKCAACEEKDREAFEEVQREEALRKRGLEEAQERKKAARH